MVEFLYTLFPVQKADPVTPLVPQSEFDEQVMLPVPVQLPLEQVWVFPQTCFTWGDTALVQVALAAPGLLHVYVL